MIYGMSRGIVLNPKMSWSCSAIGGIANIYYHNIPSTSETDSIFKKKLYLEIFSYVVWRDADPFERPMGRVSVLSISSFAA